MLRALQLLAVALWFAVAVAQAPEGLPRPKSVLLSSEQAAIVRRMILREHAITKDFVGMTPILETYIQTQGGHGTLRPAKKSDQYWIGHIILSQSSGQTNAIKGPFFYDAHSRGFRVSNPAVTLSRVLLLDSENFDEQHYDFSYVRRDFLGSVRTLVFDVRPKGVSKDLGFTGRLWVEDAGGNIVRFNGRFGGHAAGRLGDVHLDSWRENLQPGHWLPVGVYVEGGNDDDERSPSFKGQIYVWGYSIRPNIATDEREQSDLERLTETGLLAQQSRFDKELEQIGNNILLGNRLQLNHPIHCRVMLTRRLESLTIGNTIVLSKGLIDVLPTEADIAAVLSFQLAHIVLDHPFYRHYVVGSALHYPHGSNLEMIRMDHSDADNSSAAQEAINLLQGSVYARELSEPKRFFQQLYARSKSLPALTSPLIGDSLLSATGAPWLDALPDSGLQPATNSQDFVAARPLGAGKLRIDAWTNQVVEQQITAVTTVTSREEIAFNVIPDLFHQIGYEAHEYIGGSGGNDNDRGAPEVPEKPNHVVHVLFATDRARGAVVDGAQRFTNIRARDERLSFGSAEVSVPPGHELGKFEEPSLFKLRVTSDKNRDVVLISAKSVSVMDFNRLRIPVMSIRDSG